MSARRKTKSSPTDCNIKYCIGRRKTEYGTEYLVKIGDYHPMWLKESLFQIALPPLANGE